MKAPINDGGPAFPHTHESWHTYPIGMAQPPSGMSLRDWFAGQETLSDYDHPDSWDYYKIVLRSFNGEPPVNDKSAYYAWENEARAKIKLARADAMIAAREVKL